MNLGSPTVETSGTQYFRHAFRGVADLAAYQLSDFTSLDDFLGAVLKERGHELWGEGCRRSDLIRYGLYIDYAIKYKGSTTAKEYMNLMPLPQSVITESSGQVIQNEGY